MELYYFVTPHPQAFFKEEEKALFTLLSTEKKKLCAARLTPRTARMSFYGEIFALWLWYKAHPHATRLPKVRYAKGGKPCLPDGFHYSLTHTEGSLFIAVHTSPVGIDAEPPRPVNSMIAERYFSAEDREKLALSFNPNHTFSTLWTRLEAYGKYLGEGITYPPKLPSETPTGITTPSGYILAVYPPCDPAPALTDLSFEEAYRDLKKFI